MLQWLPPGVHAEDRCHFFQKLIPYYAESATLAQPVQVVQGA